MLFTRVSLVFLCTWTLCSDPVTNAESQALSTVLEVIQSDVLLADGFNFASVLPAGKPELASFALADAYACPAGSVAVGAACVPCAPGSFFRDEECALCPVGSYSSRAGTAECSPCSPGYTTTGPGATALTDCKASCEPGRFYSLASRRCEDCGHGFYQAEAGSFRCEPCGVGKTTLTETSTDEEDCQDECPDGKQLNAQGLCSPCVQGTFRTKGVHKTCRLCPDGVTTEGEGSVAAADCNTPSCKPGSFLIPERRVCQPCPRGTYQDESLQVACKPCQEDHTTPAEGQSSVLACYNTNQCETGENDCSWHAICVDLPDTGEGIAEAPRFQCKCKPGFQGNGTHCQDACIDYCLNGGVCKKNAVGQVECACREHFEGRRCEARYQPKTEKVAHIAGGIGGSVAILIIIVIVIWMICFRYTTPLHRPTLSRCRLSGSTRSSPRRARQGRSTGRLRRTQMAAPPWTPRTPTSSTLAPTSSRYGLSPIVVTALSRCTGISALCEIRPGCSVCRRAWAITTKMRTTTT